MIFDRHFPLTPTCKTRPFVMTVFLCLLCLFAYPQVERSMDSDVYSAFGLDTTTVLHDRIYPVHERIQSLFRQAGMEPVNHQLTKAELEIVQAGLEGLPRTVREVLKKRLLQISFVDGIANTAFTAPVNPKASTKLFTITIRAEILEQTVTEWLTAKEKDCFDFTDSDIDLVFHGGTLNALQFVLIHEATHILDASRIFKDAGPSQIKERLSEIPFTRSYWTDRIHVSPTYDNPLLDSTFYKSRNIVPIDKAIEVYGALMDSPFVSLYGRNSCHEDLAEYVAVQFLTETKGEPYYVELLRNGQTLFKFEPLRSKLVQKRFDYLNRLLDGLSH